MTEKLQINGKEIWVTVEPHAIRVPGDGAQEYFTATYHSDEPGGQPGGILFIDEQKAPMKFNSPVQAIEYASEKLLGIE